MKSLRSFAAILFFAGCASSPAPRTAAQPVASVASAVSEPFAEEIAAFEAQDKIAPVKAAAVLFVGSSSIRLWPQIQSDFPGVDVIQRGFGGSELGDVVRYAPRIVLPYKPRMIVLYAGDNDLAAGKSPQMVFEEYRQFVALVHTNLPNTKIAFVAIKPSGSRWALAGRMKEANELIQTFVSRDPRLLYVDVFSPMLGPDGLPREELFVADRLHMTAAGYAIWRELLNPIVANH